MRRGIVGVLMLLGVVAVPRADATLGPLPATVWVAERVAAHAPRFEIHAYYRYNRHGARVAVVAADVERGRIVPTAAQTHEGAPWHMPVAYHGGARYGCLPNSTCDLITGNGLAWFAMVVPENRPQPDRVYLAISAHSIEVELVASAGWRLQRTRLRARYALSDRGGGTGASALGEHVERFGEATLAGGRRGSIAVATPPCRQLHRIGGAREGVGTATLSGGTAARDFDCRADLGDPVSVAYGPTTWRFSGDVVGVTTGTTRLTVIDL